MIAGRVTHAPNGQIVCKVKYAASTEADEVKLLRSRYQNNFSTFQAGDVVDLPLSTRPQSQIVKGSTYLDLRFKA